MTQKAKKQIEYAVATHAIENLSPSKEALQLCREVADGRLSGSEAAASLMKRYGLKRGAARG